MICDDCLHYPICFERRGECTEYKTLDMIRREIIELNNAHKEKPATCTKADQRPQGPQL